MLILRELAFGSRRFSELKTDLPGISANVLTQRLTEMVSLSTIIAAASFENFGSFRKPIAS